MAKRGRQNKKHKEVMRRKMELNEEARRDWWMKNNGDPKLIKKDGDKK